MTLNERISVTFRDEITFESALESSEYILYDEKKFQEVKVEISIYIEEWPKIKTLGVIFLNFKVWYMIWEVKVGLNFLVGFGGTIGKYPGAKQSLDSDTNSL